MLGTYAGSKLILYINEIYLQYILISFIIIFFIFSVVKKYLKLKKKDDKIVKKQINSIKDLSPQERWTLSLIIGFSILYINFPAIDTYHFTIGIFLI